jgi:sugar phosphate isomerase/epimerase
MRTTLTRRGFLRASAIALAGTAAMGAAGLPALAEPRTKSGTPSTVRLGLASYTLRNFVRSQVILDMKQLHVSALNAKDVKDHLPMDLAGEAAALKDYAANGIKLHAVGVVYFREDNDADIRSKFEYAKHGGVKVVVAGDPPPSLLPKIEKYVQEYDIRFAIHNHGPEDKVWPSPLTVLKAVKGMDPRMGCCIDVGHTVRAGTDVVEAIHAAGPRLFNMHMKDLTNFHDKASQVAVGDGLMPVRAIFEALIRTRYKGFVDLEYEVHPDNPMPGVTASFAYMRGVLSGMGYTTLA